VEDVVGVWVHERKLHNVEAARERFNEANLDSSGLVGFEFVEQHCYRGSLDFFMINN
jgi:hypothetical protein